jgi:hypothetical protein
MICHSPSLLQELREQISNHYISTRYNYDDDDGSDLLPFLDLEQPQQQQSQEDDNPVILVLEFWKKMDLLLYCAYYGRMAWSLRRNLYEETCTAAIDASRSLSVLPIVHLLSSLEWCPNIVAQLAISLFPWQCQQEETQESVIFPLHRWARTRTLFHPYQQINTMIGMSRVGQQQESDETATASKRQSNQDESGILRILCESCPEAATKPDPSNHNRLPMHSALAIGKPWGENIQVLFTAYPDAIQKSDPRTGLPCFCLPAMGATTATGLEREEEIEYTARQLDQQRLALCWSYLSKREKSRALQRAETLLDCQRLTTIYEVLRRHPSAVEYSCAGRSREE